MCCWPRCTSIGAGLFLALSALIAAPSPQDPPAPDRPQWKPGETCVSIGCHSELRGDDHHGPVALRKCEPCHESIDGTHAFQSRFEGPDLCRSCHESFFSFDGPVHAPDAAPGASVQCTRCHDPHGGTGTKFLLRKKVQDGLCFECHERGELLGGKQVHGRSLFGENCTLCHDPHSSDHPKLLHRSEFVLCSTCHEEMTRLEGPKSRWHEAAAKSCAGCHDPHSSNLPHHLKQTLPELCLGCHEEQARELGGAHIHAPLKDQSGKPTECLSCHDPHASEHEHLLDAPQMEVCLRCHDQPIEVAGRAAIPSVKAQIEKGEHLHGPLAEGNCVACHQPHASDHARLLKGEFPAEFYAPFTRERYDLCFQCHEDVLVLAPETQDATRFRDGTRNLHALHVQHDQKGRSCRSCHEAHASELPFLLRGTVLFGEWEMPIGFEQLPDGGACTPGCHTHLEYHRDAK